MDKVDQINRIRQLMYEGINPNKMIKDKEYYDYLSQLKSRYPNTPEDVLKEFLENNILSNPDTLNRVRNTYFNHIDPEIKEYGDWFLSGPWELKILKLGYDDFTKTTRQAFIDRDFGNVNSYMVPDEEERVKYHRSIVKGEGENEAVILVLRNGKYDLIEGWHRVMAILQLGDNGGQPYEWEPQLIKAYVLEKNK